MSQSDASSGSDPVEDARTRYVTGSGMRAGTLPPIELARSRTEARRMLAFAVRQLEREIQSFESPPQVSIIKVQTPVRYTLLSKQVEQSSEREFYTIGLEYRGDYSIVIAALGISDMGSTASLSLESQEVGTGFGGALLWLVTKFFSMRNGFEAVDNLGGLSLAAGAGFWLTLSATYSVLASFIVFLALPLTLTLVGTWLDSHKSREVESFLNNARFRLSSAYDALDLSSIRASLLRQQATGIDAEVPQNTLYLEHTDTANHAAITELPSANPYLPDNAEPDNAEPVRRNTEAIPTESPTEKKRLTNVKRRE